MKRILQPAGAAGLCIALLFSAAGPAHASVNEGLLLLAAGRSDCRAKRFAAGVKKILDAALVIQRANASHPANRQWLPQVRQCLRSWVRHTANRCRKVGQATALVEFGQIQKKIRYLAAPLVKRMINAERPRCVDQIVKLRIKECVDQPGRPSLKLLERLETRLKGLGVDARRIKRLRQGRAKCAFKALGDSESRCLTAPTVTNLKDLGAWIGLVSATRRLQARQAYEKCAKAMGIRGWAICQARRYLQGRFLLKEAVIRYDFFKARDRGFLAKMKNQWLPRCGTFVGRGYFTANVEHQRIRYRLAARIQVEVSRSNQGNVLLGEMRVRYDSVRGVRQGCRVLITPRNGRYSLKGSENRGARRAVVTLQRGMPQTEALEEIQVTCGNHPPDLSKARHFHRLLKRAGVFSLKFSTAPGSLSRYRYTGALGGGAKGSIAGTLKLTVLR